MTNLTSHRAVSSLAAAVAAAIIPFSTVVINPAFAASIDPNGVALNQIVHAQAAKRTVIAQAPYGASSTEVGPTQPTMVQLPRSAKRTVIAQAPYGASSTEVGPTQPTMVQLPHSLRLPRASVAPGHVDIWVPPVRVL